MLSSTLYSPPLSSKLCLCHPIVTVILFLILLQHLLAFHFIYFLISTLYISFCIFNCVPSPYDSFSLASTSLMVLLPPQTLSSHSLTLLVMFPLPLISPPSLHESFISALCPYFLEAVAFLRFKNSWQKFWWQFSSASWPMVSSESCFLFFLFLFSYDTFQ